MAIADDTDVAVPRRLWTIADLAVLPTHLPTGPVRYELLRGQLIMMSPTGGPHGLVHMRLSGNLWSQADLKKRGTTFIETGLILTRKPDTVVGPDVMFFVAGVEPQFSPEGWAETIPNLVAEIRSKNDTQQELADKAALYLKSGVELVWVADPRRKTVNEYRRDSQLVEFSIADVLTAESIIPSFRLPLVELFF